MKVNGDCGMCETTIEKVGNKKNQYKTDWDADTKLAIITYDSKKTGLDAILKNIALSGYDNVSYLAPDEAYAKLPGCCQYKRDKKAVVKTITEPTTDAMGSLPNHTGHTAISANQPATKSCALSFSSTSPASFLTTLFTPNLFCSFSSVLFSKLTDIFPPFTGSINIVLELVCES